MKNKLRILVISPSFMPALNYGGTTHSIFNLYKVIAEKNEVTVLTSNLNGDEYLEQKADVKTSISGVTVIYHNIVFLKKLFFSFKFCLNIFKEIKKHDIVHIQSLFFLPAFVSYLLLIIYKKPYFVSTRGSLVKDLIEKKRPFLKKIWIYLIIKRILKNASIVHVTSKWEKDNLNFLNLGIDNIKIIYNGVVKPSFKQNVNYLNLPNNFIFYIGRISYEKNLELLIDSLNLNKNVNLVIAGDGNEVYKNKIINLIKKYKLEKNIYFIGNIKDEKWSLYKKAKLTILTSYSENFGNVILESMSVGTPVIVTKNVGASEVVKKFEAGVVVDSCKFQISKAIQDIINNENLAKELGKNALYFSHKYLTWDSIADKYLSVYTKIVNHN